MANERARELRKQMTRQEIKLWLCLRDRRRYGYHFRRQVPFGPYILDFACFKHRLVVELDGGQHGLPSHQIRDADRDAFLRTEGFQVLRFWNSDVDRNLQGVMDTIASRLCGPPPRPAAGRSPLPTRGRDVTVRPTEF